MEICKVEVKRKNVATIHDGVSFEVKGEGEQAKNDVVGVMRAWFEKKGAESPYGQ